jgi:hypothetical protein
MNATTHDTTPARDEPNIDGTSGSRAGQFGAGRGSRLPPR